MGNTTSSNHTVSINTSPPTNRAYDYMFKLVVCGDHGAGKSSLLVRLVEDIFREIRNDERFLDFRTKTIGMDNMKIKLQIWDMPPPGRFSLNPERYLRGAVAALLLFDTTDRPDFDSLYRIVNVIRGSPLLVIVVGTKIDLCEERQVSFEEGQAFTEKHQFAKYIEVSNKTGENTYDAWLSAIIPIYKKYIDATVESIDIRV